jgi:hypothetical protein
MPGTAPLTVLPVPVGYDISGAAPMAVFKRSDGMLVWNTTGGSNWVPYPAGRRMIQADASGAPTQTIPGFTWANGSFLPTSGQLAPGNYGGTGALSCTTPYVWNGTQCVLPNAAVPPSSAPPAGTPPAGFTVVGNDSSGNPIFANPQGVLYSWTGSGMQLWSGQLASSSSAAAQMQAALQNALAQGQSAQQAAAAALQQAQSAGVAVTPQLQQQVATQTQATQAAPIAAGVGGGLSLSSTASMLSIAAAVVGLMFATAHPAGRTPRRRSRGRRRA